MLLIGSGNSVHPVSLAKCMGDNRMLNYPGNAGVGATLISKLWARLMSTQPFLKNE